MQCSWQWSRYFYPRPPRGGRLHWHIGHKRTLQFLSTPSARRATELSVILGDVMLEFLSTPSARRATRHPVGVRPTGTYFYPRPPRGGRPFVTNETISIIEFLSTPSARRATVFSDSQRTVNIISIHALREEGDEGNGARLMKAKAFLSTPSARRATSGGGFCLSVCSDFYPRPPRGGRPHLHSWKRIWRKFLSTPSARRATVQRRRLLLPASHFYPRPPRGGRLVLVRHSVQGVVISIHALREEGDPCLATSMRIPTTFLSTPSARRATLTPQPKMTVKADFYPRPPRGGRHEKYTTAKLWNKISIHALREEGDERRTEQPF